MPVVAIGGRHEAAMGAAEKLRGGPTWGSGEWRCCSRVGGIWRGMVGRGGGRGGQLRPLDASTQIRRSASH